MCVFFVMTFLSVAENANAISLGCDGLDGVHVYIGNSSNKTVIGSSGANQAFEEGEEITLTISVTRFFGHGAGTTFTLYGDQGGTASTALGTTFINATNTPSEISYTVDASANWTFAIQSDRWTQVSIGYACTAAPAAPGGGTNTSTVSGYKNAVRSASRSQSDVLEKNLNSRVDAAFQATGERGGSLFGETLGKRLTLLAEQYSEAKRNVFVRAHRTSKGTDLRQLAMLGSFDSSRMKLGIGAEGIERPEDATDSRSDVSTPKDFTLWGHGSYVSLDNDFNQGGQDNRYDGDAWGYTLGLDYRIRSGLIAGVSLGYTVSDIDTHYDSGNYSEKMWSFAPYIVARPIKGLKLSAVAGFGLGDVEQARSGATGDGDSQMTFMALRGGYTVRPIDDTPFDVTGRVGFTAAKKVVDSMTLSDNTAVDENSAHTRRLRTGVELGYTFDVVNARITPFIKGDLVYDFMDAVNGDNQAYDLGGGVRIRSDKTGLSGTLSLDRQLGREDYESQAFNGMIAYSFGTSDVGERKVAPFISSTLETGGTQNFGGGIDVENVIPGMDCGLNVTHNLYAADEDDETWIEGETIGKVHLNFDF